MTSASKSICFVNDYFLKDSSATITGPMVQTYLLGTGLARRGWRVEFVATTYGDRTGTVEVHDGIRVHYVKAYRRLEMGSARAVARKLRAVQADFYYQRGRSMLTGITAQAAREHKAKFVWASAGEGGCRRGKYLGQQLQKKSGIKRWIHRPIYAWADRLYEEGIASADLVVVQTAYQQGELRKAFQRDSIILKSGHPVPPESVLQKSRPPIVMWIGAVKPAKQPHLFLDLVSRCDDDDAKFLLVGRAEDTQWKTRLAKLAVESPRFSYRDEVPFDQVSELFAQASLLVNTTIPDYEGFPNVFLQAWLHGVPVVSLHADPDSLLKQEGIGCRTDTFDRMVEETKRLLVDHRQRGEMGKRARQFAEREFGLEKILTDFEKLIGAPG